MAHTPRLSGASAVADWQGGRSRACPPHGGCPAAVDASVVQKASTSSDPCREGIQPLPRWRQSCRHRRLLPPRRQKSSSIRERRKRPYPAAGMCDPHVHRTIPCVTACRLNPSTTSKSRSAGSVGVSVSWSVDSAGQGTVVRRQPWRGQLPIRHSCQKMRRYGTRSVRRQARHRA